MSSFNYRENGRGIHAGFVGLMVLVLLLKTVENEHSETALKVLTRRYYCRHGIECILMLKQLATECRVFSAKFQDLRFGIKFFFIQKEIKEEKV